jgi:trigger factor
VQAVKVRVLSRLPLNIMKITLENSKGLNKDFKISVDKTTMTSYMNEKYDEVKKNIVLKGFRPGKVPKEILQKQFGKQIMSEVLDKVLRETSTKALEEKKIKPIGQPKIDLKTYGENKELEYIISVTEYPKIDLKQIENINFDDYSVKVEAKEVEKRIELIAAHQNKFIDAEDQIKSKEGDLVVFDYKATVEGSEFKGNEGKNTQLVLGKDLFIKGFDKHLIGYKKNDSVNVEANLPENFPEKEYQNKKAVFNCKILAIKHKQDVKIDDEFA